MKIKKIKLKNFQKHSNLELDFVSGVNVIYGATDAGKSCVRRAITWVFFNSPQGDIVRKENTKKTVVTVTLDNHIEIERIKSKTVNAYKLKIKDKEKKFDTVGRSVPEEISNLIKMKLIEINGEQINLNISNQIAFPFLLDKSGIFRSKLFNKLTGSEITDKVLQDLNKDLLKISKESKLLKKDLIEKKNNKDTLKSETDILDRMYKKIYESYKELEKKNDRHEGFEKLYYKLKELEKNKETIREKKDKVNNNLPSTVLLKAKNEKLSYLSNIKISFNKIKEKLKDIKIKKDNFNYLKHIDIDNLKKIWSKIDMLKTFSNKINVKRNKKETLKKAKEKSINTLNVWVKKYKKELKTRGVCPTCKQDITEETLKKIK